MARLIAFCLLVLAVMMAASAPFAVAGGVRCMVADWSLVPHGAETKACTDQMVFATIVFAFSFLGVLLLAILALVRFKLIKR